MFANKTIIITGASSGLGRQLSIALAKQGVNLVLFGRNESELQKTAKYCTHNIQLSREMNPRVDTITGDITKTDDCDNLIKQTIARFGQIDILINNAGISQWQKFEGVDLLALHQLMQTNYFGAVNCTHFALPYLKKSHGLIVVVSSVQGLLGVPCHSGYGASKHALQGFFSALRNELNGQVDILIVSPSWIHGTNLRKNAIGQQKKKYYAKSHIVDVTDCTQKIIAAMEKRKKRLIIPKKLAVLIAIKNLFPNLVDKIIIRAINKESPSA